MARRPAPRRKYQPGAPLFARRAFKLSGQPIAVGALIPAELMTARRHLRLWQAGKADHVSLRPHKEPAPMPLETATSDLDLERLFASQLAELEAATAPVQVMTPEGPAPALTPVARAPQPQPHRRRGR